MTKEELKAALDARGVEYDPEAKKADLEAIWETPIKHTVTQEDLDNNPGFAEEGVVVGDEVELPAPKDIATQPEGQTETEAAPTAQDDAAEETATVKMNIKHDGEDYAPGSTITLERATIAKMRASGLVE